MSTVLPEGDPRLIEARWLEEKLHKLCYRCAERNALRPEAVASIFIKTAVEILAAFPEFDKAEVMQTVTAMTRAFLDNDPPTKEWRQ
jgi:hypothetical protein